MHIRYGWSGYHEPLVDALFCLCLCLHKQNHCTHSSYTVYSSIAISDSDYILYGSIYHKINATTTGIYIYIYSSAHTVHGHIIAYSYIHTVATA